MAINKANLTGPSNTPALRHFTLIPSDTVDEPIIPKAVRCQAEGTAVLVDMDDTAISYTLVVGEIIPLRVKRVNSTGTTATLVGFA
jgi:hypothetical protein